MNKVEKQNLTFQPSIVKQKRRIRPTPLYRRENMAFFLTEGNATIPSIEKFADDQLDFICSNLNVIFLNEFCLSKGVTRDTYHEWIKRSPYLKARHELGKQIIGLRREKRMVEHNPASLAHRQYQFSESWGEADLRNAELKKRDMDTKSGTVNVYITPDEVVEEVKERIPDIEDN